MKTLFRIGLLASTATIALGVVCPAPHASFNLASRLPALSRAGGGPLSDIAWIDRVYTAATGEPVDVSVSPSYQGDEAIGQRWADAFAALPHGAELKTFKAYIAPLPEVQAICGGSAVGCYGDDQLVITNEPALGYNPEEVARHEYGHHIAQNRSNAPWPAIDWGPKRWATATRICPLVRSNKAYPGDQSLLYQLDPGEAFAEAYRVLVDIKLGDVHPTWPIIDPSFYPDQAALDAIERDIRSPWTGPTTHTFHTPGAIWARRVTTPLDGTMTVHLTRPAELSLVGDDGRVMRPTRQQGATRTYLVCGVRSVTIRARATGRDRGLDLRVTIP